MDVEYDEEFDFHPLYDQLHSKWRIVISKSTRTMNITLITTKLLRSIFIARIRCVVRSRHRITLPKLPRPRIFKYSKSFICYSITKKINWLNRIFLYLLVFVWTFDSELDSDFLYHQHHRSSPYFYYSSIIDVANAVLSVD